MYRERGHVGDQKGWWDGNTSWGSPQYSYDTAEDEGVARFRGSRRLVDRGGDFHQCKGKISLRKKIKRRDWRALYGVDLFHSLVNAPTYRVVGILLGGYLLIIVFFSLLYFGMSLHMGCNLGLDNYTEAFTFALETMATIGYGTQDIFFDDCLLPIIVLTFQVCIKLIADAVAIGVIYCRLARPHARASTVIFSDKAVLRRIRGKLYFMFQLCELRKHQLVEAHVRVYAIKTEVDPSSVMMQPEEQEQLDQRDYEDALRSRSEADENENDDEEAEEQHAIVSLKSSSNFFRSFYGSVDNSKSRDDISSMQHQHQPYHKKPLQQQLRNPPPIQQQQQQQQQMLRGQAIMNKKEGNAYDLEAGAKFQKITSGREGAMTTKECDRNVGIDDTSPLLVASGRPRAADVRKFHYQYQDPPMLPGAQGPEAAPLSANYDEHSYMQTCAMRLNHPNDELGGMLLLMTPQVVVHELDGGSPLMPPPLWYTNYSYNNNNNNNNNNNAMDASAAAASDVPGNEVTGASGLRDCVRWHPPVYRQFLVEQQQKQPQYPSISGSLSPNMRSSETAGNGNYLHPNHKPLQLPVGYGYDVEALARMEFPSVNRRTDSDFSVFVNQDPPVLFNELNSPRPVPTWPPQQQQQQQQQQPSAADKSPGFWIGSSELQEGSDEDDDDEEEEEVVPYTPSALLPSSPSSPIVAKTVSTGNAAGDSRTTGINTGRTEHKHQQQQQQSSSASSVKPFVKDSLQVQIPISTDFSNKKSDVSSSSNDGVNSQIDIGQDELRSTTASASAGKIINGANSMSSRVGVTGQGDRSTRFMKRANTGVPVAPAAAAVGLAGSHTLRRLGSSTVEEWMAPPVPLTKQLSSAGLAQFFDRVNTPSTGIPTHNSSSSSSSSNNTRPHPPAVSPRRAVSSAAATAAAHLRHRQHHHQQQQQQQQQLHDSSSTGTNGSHVVGIASGGRDHINPVAGEKQNNNNNYHNYDGNMGVGVDISSSSGGYSSVYQGNGSADAAAAADCVGDSGVEWQWEERHMIEHFMCDRQIEIIAIVEGVDAATGGMVQARHSYTCDEIEWDKTFVNCVSRDPMDGCTTIDFSRFHDLRSVPSDAPFPGPVHSSI